MAPSDLHACELLQYDAKLRSYLEEYDKAFLVHADNVGSKQFMDIRAVRPCAALSAFNVIRCWCVCCLGQRWAETCTL